MYVIGEALVIDAEAVGYATVIDILEKASACWNLAFRLTTTRISVE